MILKLSPPRHQLRLKLLQNRPKSKLSRWVTNFTQGILKLLQHMTVRRQLEILFCENRSTSDVLQTVKFRHQSFFSLEGPPRLYAFCQRFEKPTNTAIVLQRDTKNTRNRSGDQRISSHITQRPWKLSTRLSFLPPLRSQKKVIPPFSTRQAAKLLSRQKL